MQAPQSLRRRTGAERVSVSLADAGGSLPLPLASRQTLIPGIGALLGAVVLGAIAWQQVSAWRPMAVHSLADRGVLALRVLWVAGLWVAAVGSLGLGVVRLFYRESARLASNHLIHVAQLGPLRLAMEYDLTKVQHLRAVDTGKGRATVRFGYDGTERKLGGGLTVADAEARVKVIQAAIDRRAARRPSQADTPPPPSPSPPGRG